MNYTDYISEERLNNILYKAINETFAEYGIGDMSPEDAWCNYLGDDEPLFQFYNTDTNDYDNIYVNFDSAKNVLVSGYLTNAGFASDGEVEVPVDGNDFQSALEEFNDKLTNLMAERGYAPC